MSSTEIVCFNGDHLEDAAALVATRYKAERALNNSLPARFEDADAVLSVLKNYTNEQFGVATIREGRLAGFLTCIPIVGRGGTRIAYITDLGHGADLEDSQELYRAMYANLAPRWVTNGYFTHAVTVLAHEREVMDAWFSLGFGMIEIDASRDVSPIKGEMAEVEIHRAGPEDIDVVLALRIALEQHLAAAPIFIPLIIHRGKKFYEKWLPDSAYALWLAYHEGDAVALMELMPSDENTVTIIGAFTKEDIRQRGIGTALLNHSLKWARSTGYERCTVEFESANVVASSFYHGKGFKPVCYSLARHIDERITWAHEKRDHTDIHREILGV